MLRRTPVTIVLLSIISFGFVIATPVIILSVNFSSYGTIKKSLCYEYLPDTPSDVESLYLNVDYGNIKIDYIYPPVNYFVKIDVNIEMGGAGMAGKDYSDYFNIIESDSSSTPINFTMRLLSGITEPEVESLVKDVSIVITIQQDVVLDIFASVTNGDINIEVPPKVKINNMRLNLITGNIFYDLNRCIVGGNISGITNDGKIILISENAEYTQNSVWTLYSNKNSIRIIQHNRLGANVTGSITTVADVGTHLYYNDKTDDVGAKFTLYDYIYHQFLQNGTRVNFDLYLEPVGINRYTFKSTDFPAINDYILAFYLEGILNYDLCSV